MKTAGRIFKQRFRQETNVFHSFHTCSLIISCCHCLGLQLGWQLLSSAGLIYPTAQCRTFIIIISLSSCRRLSTSPSPPCVLRFSISAPTPMGGGGVILRLWLRVDTSGSQHIPAYSKDQRFHFHISAITEISTRFSFLTRLKSYNF